MAHANAALTPRAPSEAGPCRWSRSGWTISYAAARVQGRLADRQEAGPTATGPAVRPAWTTVSSRPHRCPRRTPRPVVRQDRAPAAGRSDSGPVQIADRLGLAASTVHAVLVRCRLNRLSHVDRRHRRTDPPLRTRPPRLAAARRREEAGQHPRRRRLALRRPATRANATGSATPGKPTQPAPQPDDGHRLRAHRARRPQPGRLRRDPRRRDRRHRRRRAAPRGGLVRRPRRHRRAGALRQRHRPTAPTPWRDACAELGITPKRTRPYRPQTNGKIERFHRTLADGWAFRRLLPQRIRPPKGPAGVATRVQPSPAPHRDRQALPDHPLEQPLWCSTARPSRVLPDRRPSRAGRPDPQAVGSTEGTDPSAHRSGPCR